MRFIFIFVLFYHVVFAAENWNIFPLDNYTQNINYWLNPKDSSYHKLILTPKYQNERMNQFKHRYFGTSNDDVSPWNGKYIASLMQESDGIRNAQNQFLADFDNTKISQINKLGYAQNKRLYSSTWIKSITQNLNLSQFNKLNYDKNNRAIAVNNVSVRILPTDDPFYYSDRIPGEGYPFDNLQNSVIYTGTPLYIVGKSIDGKWLFIISPDVAGWIHSDNAAFVDDKFVTTWQVTAYKALVGITQNNLSIKDTGGNYLFSAYVGTVLPLAKSDSSDLTVFVPVRNQKLMAEIKTAKLSSAMAGILPITATTANIARVLEIMQKRPYGWGNLDMYNDCSSELKNIYTLFGFYIPRNTRSIDNAGKMVDLSARSMNERLSYLMQNGIPLLTFIHINGHVVLYVGKYDKNYSGTVTRVYKEYPLVYQQVWGLRDIKQSYRSIIGQSVFLPFLSSYAEDKNLIPQSSYSMFRMIYLTQEPDKNYKPDLNELLY